MKAINLICIIALTVSMALSAIPANSQTGATDPKDPVAATPAPAQETPQPEELSIYGEVQAVNVSAGSITVQYYDYDTDEEKAMEIVVGKDSKMENAANLNELKKGDWVDVVYSLSAGTNLAKTVVVEKEEAILASEEAADVSDEE